ncbi:MAG: hypothetical protein GY898_05285 [Proteobacteria bacterium]|nr:hypothetical protein [Pseudomonadota bacterium]
MKLSHGLARGAACLLIQVALSSVSWPAGAAPVRFGVTSPHTVDAAAWADATDAERRSFLELRAAMAAAMGGEVLRMGGADPALASFSSVDDGQGRRWDDLDAAVAAFTASGMQLCLTLPQPVGS